MPVLIARLALSLATGVWPLQPPTTVVADFDPPSQVWGAGHRGVDLLGAPGQPVRSALAGTVRFAGIIAGRGVVVVDHGTTRTTYEPVVASVHRGDTVAAGQVVGSLGWLGSHCLPRTCLHWGLVEGEDHYLDPLTLVECGPRPVRLLPLAGSIAPTPRCAPGSAPGADSLSRPGARLLIRLAGVLAGMPGVVGRW
jgi:hypothetical protein